MTITTATPETNGQNDTSTPTGAPGAGLPILDIKTMLVTPQQASTWLRSNAPDNRPQRKAKIRGYARDMRNGEWQITGDTIKLTPDGILIDGQHRLQAVIEADCSVYMVIAFNVPHKAMAVIDTGIARTFADTIRDLDITNRNEIAAIVRRVVVWERGNRMGKGGDNPTHNELSDHLKNDLEGFVAATARGIDVYRARISPVGAAGTAHYLFSRIHHEQAQQFFDQLVSGANLPVKHPVLVARNRLTRALTARRREDRYSVPEHLAALVRTWNAFREDRELTQIIVSKGSLNAKNFPTPV